MDTLKYKIIKTEDQYNVYCSMLEKLLKDGTNNHDEVELLTLLIEKWDHDHNSFKYADPIELIRSLMVEHNLKSKNLSEILGVSKGLVSDILNYRKGLSKEIIRSLSSYFQVSQEAFNRPYQLKVSVNSRLSKTSQSE